MKIVYVHVTAKDWKLMKAAFEPLAQCGMFISEMKEIFMRVDGGPATVPPKEEAVDEV